MADSNLNGLGVALVTPFKKDLNIDYFALEKLIDHVIDGGVDYIVVLGTTAETPTLSPEERKELLSFVRTKVDNRVPLVLGIGGNNTMGVIREIQTTNTEGYRAILSVTPYYNKPSQEGIFIHFKEISSQSPLPLLLYNVPGRTGVNMTPATTLRLAEETKNICGIKEASGNILQTQEIINKAPEHFCVISGNDNDTFTLMKMGGKGVISVFANAFPREMKRLVNLCKEGNFKEAQRFQQHLTPFFNHLFEDGNPSGVKAVLSELGIIGNYLRLPLVPVSKIVRQKLLYDVSQLSSYHD